MNGNPHLVSVLALKVAVSQLFQGTGQTLKGSGQRSRVPLVADTTADHIAWLPHNRCGLRTSIRTSATMFAKAFPQIESSRRSRSDLAINWEGN